MKLILALLCSFISLCSSDLIERFTTSKRHHPWVGIDTISPGHGYSTDTQQMSPLQCYNVKVQNITHTSSIVQFDSGLTFSQMENTFKIRVSAKAQFFIFSASLSTEFMRSIQTSDLTLSVNYFSFIEGSVPMEIGYGADNVLTPTGKQVYQDGKNRDFGVICGDQIINEYKVGAMLILSLNLEFRNSQEKKTFELHAGGGFGSFVSVSTMIQNIAIQNKIYGKVVIHGYQEGGNPSELAAILNQKCGSHYCAASCNMTNMTNCISAIDGLLAYAVNKFPAQTSIESKKGLSSYPIGFADVLNIKFVGLKPPATYVTDAVEKARATLGDKIYENKYYMTYFKNILQNYPAPIKTTTSFYQRVVRSYDNADANIKMLMDERTGGILCYMDPETCLNSSTKLLSQLHKWNSTDWAWMDWIKKKLNMFSKIFYRVGDGGSASDYHYFDYNQEWFTLSGIDSWSINRDKKTFSFNVAAKAPNGDVNHFYVNAPLPAVRSETAFEGACTSVSIHNIHRTYTGTYPTPDSEFYFKPYVPNLNDTNVEDLIEVEQ